ncbi:hypothetical protein QCA50_014795 [Cerrena zonata]|uniref:Uncharacterized protein n=1 Tax=Cerrena zonata TaxID=2478898 RepID=A0AAW0FKJ4_9APHY
MIMESPIGASEVLHRTLLPPELLREIIMIVFTDYLEDIMPESALIRRFELDIPFFPNISLEEARRFAASQVSEDYFQIPGPYDHNHFVPLLQTSYQIREVGLSVLSDGLGISKSLSGGRLCEKPWHRIKKVVQLYADPTCVFNDVEAATHCSSILRGYGAIACAEWQSWFSIRLAKLQRKPMTMSQSTVFAVGHAAYGLHLQHGITSLKLRCRAMLCLSHCCIATIIQKLRAELERMCDMLQKLEDHRELIGDFVNEERAQIYRATLMYLKMFCDDTGTYGEHGLMVVFRPNIRELLPPYVISKIEEELDFEHLRPMIVEMMELGGSDPSPEFEAYKSYALNILRNIPQLPWNRGSNRVMSPCVEG